VSFAKDEQVRRSDQDYVDEWSELFRRAVRLRLMADVPLGMFLSGGIDSSAIAAVMSGMVGEPIKTFSVAFKEREANELEYARLIATAYNTNHHEVVVSPEDFFRHCQTGVARGRTVGPSLERRSLFCFPAGVKACQGRSYRRGQR